MTSITPVPHSTHDVPYPIGVRIADGGDRQRLIDFLIDTYEREGRMFGSLDQDAVELMADRGVSRDRCVFAIIDNPYQIEAALGLVPAKPWWTGDDGWFWTEVAFVVHAHHRRSRNFRRLIQFAKWFAQSSGSPVVINVQPEQDLQRKLLAFSRSLRMAGGIFVASPKGRDAVR